MIRLRIISAFALSAVVVGLVNGQLAEDEKEKPSTHSKVSEKVHASVSPTPAETPIRKRRTAKHRSETKKRPTSKSTATSESKKSPTPEPDKSATPRSKGPSGTEKSDQSSEPTPKTKQAGTADAGDSSKPVVTPMPKKSPTPETPESLPSKEKVKSKTKESKRKSTEATPRPKRKKKIQSKETSHRKSKIGSSSAAKSNKSPTPKKEAKSSAKEANEEAVAPASKKKLSKKSESGGESESESTKSEEKKTPTPQPIESSSPSSLKEGSDIKKGGAHRGEKAEQVKPTPGEKAAKNLPEPIRTPIPEPSPRPRPVITPPSGQPVLPPDITVEKSGLEKEQGLEPPPPPPPRRGFWPWSRQPANYRYLTSATIEAIRRAPVQRGRWKFIIVHNSGTRQGNARAFDYYHRKIRRMRNGLAYHFVIGNGTSSRDGEIEIGDRWRRQINGGHVHSDYLNNIALGICLVGDFNRDQPTRAQLGACEELIRYLQERCGKSDGYALIVRPHREVNPPRWATDCPGDVFPYGWFGRFKER